MMNKVNAMTIAALAAALCAAPSLAGESPAAVVARNRALVAKFADSVATVRYYTKRDADGKEPEIEIPYKCPNCGGTHFEKGNVSAEKGIPAEFAGFVIGPDRVLMQDVMLPPEYIDRIEVVCGGESVGAKEFEWSPAHDALVLKTASPLAKAKPLAFAGAALAEGEAAKEGAVGPRYFFLVREDGETIAGVAESKASEFRHHVEVGKDIYEGNPNTIALNADDEPVTIALQHWIELGREEFLPPAKWEWKPAAARFDAIKALETRLAKAILPAYVQLEAKKKDEGRYSRWSSDDAQDDIDTVCIVLEKGVAIVPLGLKPDTTARLAKMEATLPDGKKVALEFVGSYDKYGAMSVKFADGAPQGLEPLVLDRRAPLSLFGERQRVVQVANRGGVLKFRTGIVEVREFARTEGNEILAKSSPVSVWDGDDDDEKTFGLCTSASGALIGLEVKARKESHYWRSNIGAIGSSLLAMVDEPVFDSENIPRKADDRKRTAWLGVETQPAGVEIIREKKAVGFLGRYVERAPLVTGVSSNSPAAKAGILEGDILISARYPGGSREEKLTMDSDYGSMIDWSALFDREEFTEYSGSSMPTPWPNVENGVNAVLTEFGVGTEVIVAWVRDGRRMEAKLKLELAPVHFQNAPRSRSKTLGITVADMTYEVRKYFKFDGAASGVVIDKIKGGGPAAVAGLKPLELILQVNGEDVKDAKDFLAKTKDKKDLTFSVRRLTATRVVPIKLQ